jgi:hypothetical protein
VFEVATGVLSFVPQPLIKIITDDAFEPALHENEINAFVRDYVLLFQRMIGEAGFDIFSVRRTLRAGILARVGFLGR